MDDILVPLGFFAFLTAIIIVPAILRSRDRALLHETLRIAYEKGQPVPPEMIEMLQRDVRERGGLIARNSPDRDLRWAVILIGLAVGLVVMGVFNGQLGGHDALYGTLAGATIPGFIGLGFLVLWFFGRNKPEV